MRTITRAGLVASLTLAAGIACAGAPEGSWYVTPRLNALWLDDARNADDDVGYQLSLGHVFNQNWDGEIALFSSSHEHLGGDDLRLKGFNLSASRVFYRDGRVNPYLTFGVGRTKAEGDFTDQEETAINYGMGLLFDLSKSSSGDQTVQLRAEMGARRGMGHASEPRNPVDYVAGLGLQLNWGGRAAPRIVDTDGDGVTDDLDKCPGTPAGTAVDSSGCPLPQDDDGDGVVNDIDKCPNTPAGAKVDANGCELDADGDGVVDGRDQCPNTPAGAKIDERGCELDSDGDGVVDSVDKCPDTPKGDRVDSSGCSFKAEIKLPGVVFETNKAELLPESLPVLEGAIATLKRYPDLKIEVAGHTDSRGSDAYNLDLSSRRAATVLQYLQDGGVANSMTSRGYGERQPVASNNNDEGRQQNRRVVLRVLN
jgi:OOP family OmpA-OmpF porin